MDHNRINPLKYSIHTRLREYYLKRLIPKIKNGRLLDVGCGLGYLTEVLGEEYFKIGLDYDFHSLKLNYNRGMTNMLQSSATELPFKGEIFDVIICSELLEHLPNKMDEKALCEMARVLKPGGILLITIPALNGLRSTSKLRNLGHDDPEGGEYHYRIGYSWNDAKAMIEKIPKLKIYKKRFSMFLLSELFMDLLKVIYLKKNKFRDHSNIMDMKESFFFRLYRFFFTLLYFCFIYEDLLFASIFKGHILIIAAERYAE